MKTVLVVGLVLCGCTSSNPNAGNEDGSPPLEQYDLTSSHPPDLWRDSRDFSGWTEGDMVMQSMPDLMTDPVDMAHATPPDMLMCLDSTRMCSSGSQCCSGKCESINAQPAYCCILPYQACGSSGTGNCCAGTVCTNDDKGKLACCEIGSERCPVGTPGYASLKQYDWRFCGNFKFAVDPMRCNTP